MLDTKRLLDQFMGQNTPDGASGGATQQRGGGLDSLISGKGGLVTGAIGGGLLGLLVGGKKPRKIAGKALTYGGMAVVGGLAYKAWQNWQANQGAAGAGGATSAGGTTAPQSAPEIAAPPANTPFQPATVEAEQNLARALLRAMISAAKADGHIDAAEQKRIFERVEALQLDNEDKAFVMDELTKPLDVKTVADSASSPEEAAEIYAASLLAIDPEGAAEKGYLSMLAVRLKLDPELVQHLHYTVATAQEPA